MFGNRYFVGSQILTGVEPWRKGNCRELIVTEGMLPLKIIATLFNTMVTERPVVDKSRRFWATGS